MSINNVEVFKIKINGDDILMGLVWKEIWF